MVVQRVQAKAQGQNIHLPPGFRILNRGHEILGRDHAACGVKQADQPLVKGDGSRIAGPHDRLKGQQGLTVRHGVAHHF